MLGLALFIALAAVAWPSPPLPGHAEYADLLIPPTALALLISQRAGVFSRRARLPLAAAVAYVGWAALSAQLHRAGGWKVVGLVELATVFVLAGAVAEMPGGRDRLVRAWIVGAALMALIALVGSLQALLHMDSPLYSPRGGDLGLPFRATGLALTMNLLAAYLLVPVLLVYSDGNRLCGPRARRPLLVLLGGTLLLTLSRTLLALLAGLLFIRAFKARRLDRIGAAGLALLLLASFAALRLDLYRDARGVVISTQPGLRWRIARSALTTAADHPLFGVGPGQEAAEVAWPRPEDEVGPMDAHLTALNLAAGLGLPGLCAFALFIVLVIRAARRPSDATAIALWAGLLAVLFDSLSVDVEDFRHVWVLLGLLAAGV